MTEIDILKCMKRNVKFSGILKCLIFFRFQTLQAFKPQPFLKHYMYPCLNMLKSRKIFRHGPSLYIPVRLILGDLKVAKFRKASNLYLFWYHADYNQYFELLMYKESKNKNIFI